MASDPSAELLVTLRQELNDLRFELKRTQRYNQLVLDSALDYAMVVSDSTGRIVEWSEGAHLILGWTREEMLGQTLHRFFTAEDRDMGVPEREMGQAASQGRADDDRWHLRADGQTFWASGVLMPIWEEKHLIGFVKVIRDLTERVEAEQRRQRHTEQLATQFQQLAESIPQLVWISDAQGTDQYFNARWKELTGLTDEQLMNDGWHALIDPAMRDQVVAERTSALSSQGDWEATFPLRTYSGEEHWCLCRALPIRDANGEVIRWFSTCTDVDAMHKQSALLAEDTASMRSLNREQSDVLIQVRSELQNARDERHNADEKVRQLQKMEAVGQLTGGIAHDFNNMLTVIMGGLNLLQAKLGRGDLKVEHYADLAMDATKRAAELTHRLLAFSRQQALAPVVVDMNRLVTSLSGMLQRTLGKGCQLEFVRHAGLWMTYVDVGSMEQVLLNLCVNARDATDGAGRITVETGNVYLDDQYAARENLAAGEYVMLAVTDTGTGMSPETLERVFEPYFTTKGEGRGTGLGLSQVYGFVKQSQGHIKLYTEVGHGTAVKIYLPRYFGSEVLTERFTVPENEVPHGTTNELILVVEDDPRVRAMTAESLMELGYRVLDADGGEMALIVMSQHPEISLLFTDVVMPGMTGRQLVDQVGLTQPELKVLYTTGYTRNAIVHHGTLDRGVFLLPKPFTLRDLAIKVRQVLDS